MSTIERLESNVRGYVRAFPTVFDTAQGAWLTDRSGRRFLDFFAGAGTLNYGHNNPLAKAAILEYVQRDGVLHGLDTATSAKIDLLEAIEQILLKPRGLDYKVQFTGPTGTNVVEAAIKLARKQKQRSHIVAFTNAYHGHSLGALALTGNQYYHEQAYGSHNNVSHLPFDGYLGDFDTSQLLDKMLCDGSSGLPKPAAVILETIQGEGGIRVASDEWLRRIAAICKRHDVLLIIDDIQVGNGRTGKFFSFEHAGIEPDLICVSKAIGGGLPMSMLLIKPECDIWRPGQHTGTFRGNNLAFVAARALLEYWRDDALAKQIESHSQLVATFLGQLADEFQDQPLQIRGRGLVWGIDTGMPGGADGSAALAPAVCRQAFEQGLIIETSGADDQVIKLLPPLTISAADLLIGLETMRSAMASVLNARRPIALPVLSMGWAPIPSNQWS
ncbi:MAG: diaminobutyrate--2-oxoglutarate transaminase [Pirellulaceae bacterium]|nr:diaminobutyrate--2-oxoglutarate transaminase [Pirellulaceae bacterium]